MLLPVMGWFLGKLAWMLVRALQALPLTVAARLGRIGGGLAWLLDARHRRIALANLQAALGSELGAAEIQAIAREHFRRLGENYVCALKTAGMTPAELADRMEWSGLEAALPKSGASVVGAIGHFGNFELFARIRDRAPGWTAATTYRALRQPALNAVLQSVRSATGVQFFERTRDAAPLRATLARGNVLLGLLADQHAGDKGLWLPFFGRPCSTSPAPAVYALRFKTPLHTAICYRTGLARWRIEVGPAIPTHAADGTAREPAELMAEVNRAFEVAIRRDPANWFWVHRRWKPASRQQLARLAEGSDPLVAEGE
jgi:lauroyl/myristoyl acyltransferase